MTNSSFNMIVSQGRIADRASGMIDGARLTAEALEKKHGVKGEYIGKSSPAENDRWPESLEKSRSTLQLLNNSISEKIKETYPIVLISNTCSASLATLPVVSNFHKDAIIIWIDAHGDFNTPSTSDSGYLGGMVVSAACGLWDSGYGSGLKSSQVLILGARDIDPPERKLLDKHSIKVIPPNRCNTEEILDFIRDKPIWIHIDWDVLEPGYLPADYIVPDGLYPDKIKEILTAVSANPILGIELAEFNATKDITENNKAIDKILDMVSPIFETFNNKRSY